jgi:hypothetical protein
VIKYHLYIDVINIHFLAPFHDSIISVLPDIITSLKNDHWKDGASVIKKMAEHSMSSYIACLLL